MIPPLRAGPLYEEAVLALAQGGVTDPERITLKAWIRPDEATELAAYGHDEQGRLKTIWSGHWPPRDREVPVALAIFATKADLKERGYIP